MDSLREMEGFGVSGKAAKQGRSGVAVGADESLTWKMMMTRRMASQDDRSRPFAPPNQAGIADGPTCNSNSRPKPSISIPSPAGGGEGEFLLQPFQFDISSTTAHTHIPFKSPEVMSLEFPFTRAQWKELERQTIIYKYMVASLPVPPHLLNPIAKSLPASAASHPLLGNGLNLRLSGRGGDVEPGRCRRTDGKKWRCSRDVAPDQKYCERHMHRGRPRSRKHVELLPPKKTRHSTNPPPELASSPSPSPSTIDFTNNIGPASHQVVSSLPQPLYHNQASERAAIFGSVVSSVSSQKEPRSLEWMMNGEPIPLHDDEHPSLNSLASFSSGEDQQTNTWPLFFNLDTAPLSYSDRGFIDAWSGAAASVNTTPDLGARNSVSSNGNLCLAPLSLTVGGKDAIDDEMGSVGISQPDHHGVGAKSNVSSWLSPASWAASSPGGPLAEVLRPRQVAAAIGATSDPASPIAAEGTSCSPAATAGSSPSGVLQRALASLSDSSGSNSPTPGSSGAKPDIGLVWLSHGKLASSS